MKKILFTAYSLDIGGIETALVSLLNELEKRKYKITLILEKKEGIFLKDLNINIKVKKYTPCSIKNNFIRKSINFIKQRIFIIKNKNKYDFAVSFATYSRSGSFCARVASKNNAIWCHADYKAQFNNNIDEMKQFFKQVKIDEFKSIVFVSNEGKNTFIQVFPELSNKVIKCNNFINYNRILEKSKELVSDAEREECYTFLNVSRHDEKQKKLTRLINAAEKLKNDGYKFRILMIGDGPDNNKYKELISAKNLVENILLLGKKKNPYPYFELSDAVILTSDYEGYPVSIIEAMVLDKPIITTNVSDVMEDVQGKFGIVVEKNENEIYNAMKKFIDNGYIIKEKFNVEKFNNEIINKIETMF